MKNISAENRIMLMRMVKRFLSALSCAVFT